jgi:hypothetical protein
LDDGHHNKVHSLKIVCLVDRQPLVNALIAVDESMYNFAHALKRIPVFGSMRRYANKNIP